MAAKVKALQQWCKIMCDGYRDVEIRNMTSSWKSGLAFCAIIHRYRPDLIDYDSLSKENVYENNKLAFDVALNELGIPALLDAEDMVAMTVPDKLCIITYVSQYYNYFHNKSKLGGPDVRKTVKRQQSTDSPSVPDSKKQAQDFPLRQKTPEPESMTKVRQSTFGDTCTKCAEKVYIMERHFDKGKLFHRRCFREVQRSERTSISPVNKSTDSSLSSTAERLSPRSNRYQPYSATDSSRKAIKSHWNEGSPTQNGSGVKSKIAQFSRPDSPVHDRRDSNPRIDGYANRREQSPYSSPLIEGRSRREVSPKRGVNLRRDHSPRKGYSPMRDTSPPRRKRSSSAERTETSHRDFNSRRDSSPKRDQDRNISQNAILHGQSKATAAMKAYLNQDSSHSDISVSSSTDKQIVELRHSPGSSRFQTSTESRLSDESRAVFAKYGVTFGEPDEIKTSPRSSPRGTNNTRQSPKQERRTPGQRDTAYKSTAKWSPNSTREHNIKASGDTKKAAPSTEPTKPPASTAKVISNSYSEDCIGQNSNPMCQLEPSTSDFRFSSSNDQAMMSGLLKSLENVRKQHGMVQSKSDGGIHSTTFTTKLEQVQETDIDSVIHQKQYNQGDTEKQTSPSEPYGTRKTKLVKSPLVDEQSETKVVINNKQAQSDMSAAKWRTKPATKTSPYTSPMGDSPKSSKFPSPSGDTPRTSKYHSTISDSTKNKYTSPTITSRYSPREVNLNQPAGKSIMKTKTEDEGFDLSQFKKEGNKVLKDHKKQVRRENRKSKIMETLDSISPKSLLKKTNSYSPTQAEAKSAKSPEQSRPILKSKQNTSPGSNIQTKSILKISDGPKVSDSTPVKSRPSWAQDIPKATKSQNGPSVSMSRSSPASGNNYSAFTITDSIDLTRFKKMDEEAGSVTASRYKQKQNVILEFENSNNGESETSYLNTNNSDSSVVTNAKNKKEDDRPEWMIEAERRRKARGGKYDDPEKFYLKSMTTSKDENDDKTVQNNVKSGKTGQHFDTLRRKKYENETNNNKRPDSLNLETYESPTERNETEQAAAIEPQEQSSGNTDWKLEDEKKISTSQGEKSLNHETIPPPKPKRAFEVTSFDTYEESPDKTSAKSTPEVTKKTVVINHQTSASSEQHKDVGEKKGDLANASWDRVGAVKSQLKGKRRDSPETVAATGDSPRIENVQMNSDNSVSVLIKSQPQPQPETNPPLTEWQIEAEKRKVIRKGKYKDPEFHSRGDSGKFESALSSNSPMSGEGDPYPSVIGSKSSSGISTSNSDSPRSDTTSTSESATKDTPREKNEKFITETHIDLVEPTDRPRKKILPAHEFTFSFDSSVEVESPTSPLSNESSTEGVVFGLVGRRKKKRAAPLPPTEKTTPKRKVNAEMRLTTAEIQMQLNDLDIMLRQMEENGKVLEEKIRGGTDEAMDEEEDDLMIQWFEMINEKNELVRKESELMYRQKQQDLEDRHEELEYEFRCIMEMPEDQKTAEDKIKEEELLQELLEIVALRNNIIDSMEEDRIRYIEEDKEISEIMQKKGFSRSHSTDDALESVKSDEDIKSDHDGKNKRKNSKKQKKDKKKEKKEKKEKKKKKSF